MKKYITIFSNVILAIMILLIPSNKVKADNTLLNLNDIYDNLNLTIDQSDLLDLIDYLQDYTDDYYILLVKSYSDDYYSLSVVEKSTSSLVKRRSTCDSYYTYYHSSSNNAINFILNYGNYLSVTFHSNDYDSSIASFKNNLENHNLTYLSSKSYVGMFESVRGDQRVLLYSNVDWYLCNLNNYNQSSNDNYIYNNSIIYNNDIFPSYHYYFTHLSNIIFTSGLNYDSNNNVMRGVIIDFDGYNSSYTYQFRFNSSDWIDITDFLEEYSNYFIYSYVFDTYYNGLLEVRILDSNNELVDSNSYNISDLVNYSSTLNNRNAFSYIENLKFIKFKSNQKLYNSGHLKLDVYGLFDENTNVNGYANYIRSFGNFVDQNGYILDYDFNDYFNLVLDDYTFSDDYTLNFTITQIKTLPLDVVDYEIYFEFDTLGAYGIWVYDDFINYNWDSITDFLYGYVNVVFPSNYEFAMIRSKSFNNISSSIVFDELVYSPSNTNKISVYNYYFDTNLSNKVLTSNRSGNIGSYSFYSMSFDINETDHKYLLIQRNVGETFNFYLKNDCYVYFFNKDFNDYFVYGISNSDFNSNNDLILDDDFKDFINYNSHFTNVDTGWYNVFESAFNEFKGVILSIFNDVSYFFENMPIILRRFFIVVFVLILTIFVTRFIL